jgi:predicted glycosyltransferase
LYGQYSEDIYKEIGDSSGELIQVGNHRFDNYRHHIYNKKITKKIGVAFNTRNSVEAVNSLCDMLAQYFPSENIILRGHPAEKRKFSSRFSVSPSATEASLDFLAGIDILISGSSSILLEAAAMNVHAFQVYYEEVPDFLVDYYGFIKTGVAMEVKDNKKLIADIELIFSTGQFDRRAKTALYDCSVGKPYEFDVENHIVSVVNEILQKETKRPT